MDSKMVTFEGTKKDAEAKLNEKIHEYHQGNLVEEHDGRVSRLCTFIDQGDPTAHGTI
jgi:hypothetical protein